MTLKKIIVHAEKIQYFLAIKRDNGSSKKEECNEKEAPLPAFTKSLAALKEVVQKIFGFSNPWMENVIIRGAIIGRTTRGSRSVHIIWDKPITGLMDTMEPKKLLIPIERVEEESDDYRPPLQKKYNDMIATFLKHADDYVKGKRAQMDLGFDD